MPRFLYPILLINILFLFSTCDSHSETGDHHDHDHDHDHESAEHSHEGAFDMDISQIEKFGILFDTIYPGQFADVIKVSGLIETSSADMVTVSARKAGIFTIAPHISVGASLNSGAPIGSISPEGVHGGDAAAAVKTNLEAAKKEYERLVPLFKEGLVTAATFYEAERVYNEAKALAVSAVSPGVISVPAPISGTICSLPVSSGQYVETGTPIAVISKNSLLTLRADLPSRFLSKLPEITTANFRPENSDTVFSLANLDGKRISNSATSSSTNGYIPVYFSFNGNPMTLPGGFAEVFLIGSPRSNVLAVPRDALMEMQGNCYIYVVKDGHAFEKRLVKTGSTDGQTIEITEGLNPGEEIVIKGAAVVRMAETSAIAPPSHSHNH